MQRYIFPRSWNLQLCKNIYFPILILKTFFSKLTYVTHVLPFLGLARPVEIPSGLTNGKCKKVAIMWHFQLQLCYQGTLSRWKSTNTWSNENNVKILETLLGNKIHEQNVPCGRADGGLFLWVIISKHP